MRIALLADIHSNLEALCAVLDHAEERRALDQIWILGDTVGYGPRPNECIALLRRYPQIAITGNHDQAVLGRVDTEAFNDNAAFAAAWTSDTLNDASRAYLSGQPEVVRQGQWTLVHGTLRDPCFEYLYSPATAVVHLGLQTTVMGAVGHAHVPLVARLTEGATVTFERLEDGASVEIDERARAVINPGGVGQPRDGDPRAAYALLDDAAGVVTFHRVSYDIAITQRAMAGAGLPQPLIERLSVGR